MTQLIDKLRSKLDVNADGKVDLQDAVKAVDEHFGPQLAHVVLVSFIAGSLFGCLVAFFIIGVHA